MARFDTVTIIGVGLLGGSLGLALKARGLAGRVRGAGHRQSTLETALDMGAIDAAYLDAREAAADADLIVICTPAAAVPAALDTIHPLCQPHTVVTDVASTKARICAYARDTWPHPSRFIGSHPMAGSEKFGPENASAELYEGSVTLVQTDGHLAEDARRTVVELWESTGSKTAPIEPERHDLVIARTSHLPHAVSACLATLVSGMSDARPLIGSGFRDMTRIAAGRPEIWRDICLTNPEAIIEGLDALVDLLQDFRGMTARGDAEALAAFFAAGRAARDEVAGP